MSRSILLCTVGTSLFFPNLNGLEKALADDAAAPIDKKTIDRQIRPAGERLAIAYQRKDWSIVADALLEIPATERLCGAEINSTASIIANGYAPANVGIYFLHSDTVEGRNIATVLTKVFRSRGHAPVAAVPVPDLQDQDAKRFRTKGLRNLAKLICGKVREHTPAACAINATGGYKAQIAIAVLLGQALGIPVYYMHERFSSIIAFPPMPIALDFDLWMRSTGLLTALRQDAIPRNELVEDWDEKLETLVETTELNGVQYLELSATGQIFCDTFRERFRSNRDQFLPPPALKQLPPMLHDHGAVNLVKDELMRFLTAATSAVPAVVRCVTRYCNAHLSVPRRFHIRGGDIEGVFSDGTTTVKFLVESTATTPGQMAAVVAALNEWLMQNS